jgi:DNA-binding NarL/FixJ family response regulator
VGFTVLVIDRERTFADALAIRLDAEDDVRVVAVAQAGARPSPGPHADVILLDADVAEASRLCAAYSGAGQKVVMLSSTSEPARIVDAIEAGALAWVRKDESMDRLLGVLRGVARGETWLPVAETGNVLALLIRRRDGKSPEEGRLAMLTPREREVLDCLADGAGRSEVAARLHLSANTVRTHLQNLMAKLGVHSTLEAVAVARSARRR